MKLKEVRGPVSIGTSSSFNLSLSHVLHQVILSRVRVPVFNSSMIESIQNVLFSQTCYSTNQNARYMIKLFKEINILHIKISKPRNSDPPSVPGYHGFVLHTRHSQSSPNGLFASVVPYVLFASVVPNGLFASVVGGSGNGTSRTAAAF